MEIHPYLTSDGIKNQLKLSDSELKELGILVGGMFFNESETIICGTFPPQKEYVQQKGYLHYSSNRNKFWGHIDSIFNAELKFNLYTVEERITNAKKKIEFARKQKIGFIDIFSKVSRSAEDAKDEHLTEPWETIFDNGIFESAFINKSVRQVIFVYKMSKKTFYEKFHLKYPDTEIIPIIKKNNVSPLIVDKITICKKEIYLIYSPIHGNITDDRRRLSLKKALSGFPFR